MNTKLEFLKKDTDSLIQEIDIEIADTEEKRNEGLMFRNELPENAGMLFIYEEEQPLSFWMKNTFIPLDIIYIDAQKNIVTIKENVEPISEQPIPSEKPAKYVVEVNAGFCDKYKINIGDKIRI